jgi:hypothetical protein
MMDRFQLLLSIQLAPLQLGRLTALTTLYLGGNELRAGAYTRPLFGSK